MTMEGMESTEMAPDALKEQTPTMTAEQVRKVVQREKAHAAEKAKQEATAQYEQELAAYKASQGSQGGMAPQQLDEDKVYSQVIGRLMNTLQEQQEQQRRADFETQMKQVAASYLDKMDKGRGLYEDFEKVTAAFEPQAFPKVVQLVSSMDNAADVIYELNMNKGKLTHLEQLAERSPRMAMDDLKSLSESIQQNKLAKENNVKTNPPLSRTQPSASAGSDSGTMSLRDLKKAKWLRR